jgi:hypothetical protein
VLLSPAGQAGRAWASGARIGRRLNIVYRNTYIRMCAFDYFYLYFALIAVRSYGKS